MILSHLQKHSLPLLTDGSVTDVLNARPDIFDAFHPLPMPQVMIETGRRILGLDRRGGRDLVISLDTESDSLCIEGAIGSDDVYVPLQEPIATGVGDILAIAACGAFLCCRRADASLFFLRYEPLSDSYSALGTLPREPLFSLRRIDRTPLSCIVGHTAWPHPASDLRAQIPLEAQSLCSRAMKQAWEAIRSEAAAADAFIQPVTVRIAARLFDGHLYSVSPAMRVPGAAWQGADRCLLPVDFDNDGRACGTRASAISATPYRIEISLHPFDNPLWHDFFRGFEVYVETERNAISDVADCSVTYAEANKALSLFLPMRPLRELDSALGDGPFRLQQNVVYPFNDTVEVIPAPMAEPVALADLTPVTPGADVFLSHGSLLHSALGSFLSTSHPGNPLLAAASTGLGSTISALAALPCGGGAYTRQYIYACTETAVFALTCDSEGHHTNCRPIAPHTVSSQQRVVTTDDAVYALSDKGCLLRLRNANPEIMYRGLPPYDALQWDSVANELYLIGTGKDGSPPTSLVIQLAAPFRAFRRELAATGIIAQNGRVLCLDGGCIYFPRPYTVYGEPEHTWQAAAVDFSLPVPELGSTLLAVRGAVWAPARFSLSLSAYDELAAADIDTGQPSPLIDTHAHWQGGRRQFLLPLRAPASTPFLPDYRLSVRGRWSALESPRLASLEASVTPAAEGKAGRNVALWRARPPRKRRP